MNIVPPEDEVTIVPSVADSIRDPNFQEGVARVFSYIHGADDPIDSDRTRLGRHLFTWIKRKALVEGTPLELEAVRLGLRSYLRGLNLDMHDLQELPTVPKDVEDIENQIENQMEFGKARVAEFTRRLQLSLLAELVEAHYEALLAQAESKLHRADSIRFQTDALTGLLTRAAANARIEQMTARDPEQEVAVYLMDGDKFKSVNDTYGHGAGDDVLREMGARLESITRPGDLLYRYGGEEIAKIAFNVNDPKIAMMIAERQRLAIASEKMAITDKLGHRRKLDRTVTVGFSLGTIADVERLLREADSALYRGKDLGRNISVQFTAGETRVSLLNYLHTQAPWAFEFFKTDLPRLFERFKR